MKRWGGVRALCSVMLMAASAGSASGQASTAREAIAATRAGGVTVVCRHAMTDSFNEREPVDYDDPSTQRKLSPAGEEQSRRIGAALDGLGVRVIDAAASPMHRAHRTAELMLGRPARIEGIWHTNGSDYGGPAREERRMFLSRRVAEAVVLVVSHIGTMSSVLPEARGSVAEGDCVVVRGNGSGFAVVGIVPWRSWLESGVGETTARTVATARWGPLSK